MREGARQIIRFHPGGDLANQPKVLVDRRALRRKRFDQVVAKRARIVREIDAHAARVMELVVHLAQRCPAKTAIRERREQAPRHAALGDFADRVHTDVPHVSARSAETVCEAAGHVVLLEHQHALAESRQHRRCGHAAHARADHQVIPWPGTRGALAPRLCWLGHASKF